VGEALELSVTMPRAETLVAVAAIRLVC
jgi:hypothetical protein